METPSIEGRTLFMSVRDYFITPIDTKLALSFSIAGGREFVRAWVQFVFCLVGLVFCLAGLVACVAAILLPIAIFAALIYGTVLYVFAYILFFIIIAFLFFGLLSRD